MAMADDYKVNLKVEVDSDAYDDPMDALTYVNDILEQSDDITGVDATMEEDSTD